MLLCVALSWAASTGAGAAAPRADETAKSERHMEVVQVEGAIDPVVADLIIGSLRRAQTNGASVVILQISSNGALDTAPGALTSAVRSSRVPVVAWVGPGRASVRGAAAALAVVAYGAASPGARIGPILPLRLDDPEASDPVAEAALTMRPGLPRARLSGQKAIDAGLVDLLAPTLGDLIVNLNGREVVTASGPVRLSTAKVIDTKDGPRQTADQPVRFLKLGTLASVQHSLASPSVAFLLLVVGLSLIVFEFFTIGVGLAGIVGAGAVAGAFFGFSHLPVAPWALALVLLSTLGFAIDVQAGHQGFWTAVGVVGLLLGSLGLYDGSPLLNVPLWLVLLVFVGQVVFMLGGMTVAVRNRFSIPTVGRASMIGELGEAHTDLNPDGVVTVRGAPWRARTGRNRPVSAGLPIRVVAVDRLVLEVEPGDTPAEV
jgi:membrane-bound serine protease (ClpP class)